MMNHDVRKLISYSAGGITSKVLLKSERLNVTLFCMAAGTDIGEHTSAREGVVSVLEGAGVFTVENERVAMKPGVLIHLRANQLHSITAEQDTSFLLTLTN